MENKLGTIAIIIAVVSLIIAIWAVDLNRVPGPEGPKGDTGLTGIKGEQGKQGDQGKDAPINNPPVIRLLTQSGDYVAILPSILHSCKYTYNIFVGVTDSDDYDLRISFYWGTSSNGPWNLNAICYGGNGTYSSTKVYEYTSVVSQKKTNYWLIEAWDGSDISTEVFSYTIIP